MEGSSSGAGNHQPHLPPGFRFHPTDEELVVHYLKKQAASVPLPVAIIAEVDIYKYDPWELPSKASFGEQEWYFFSPRERKYPNGERPNRAATSGYWKATGTDKPILTANGTQKIGVKKALVFYGGKPPKGIKTNWIMHEYRLVGNNSTTNKNPGINIAKKASLRLDDWVLCRIFKKSNSISSTSMEDTPVSRATSSMDGYQSPIPGPGKSCDHGNYFPGNGSAIPGNPMSISPLASSSLDGMRTNGTIFSSMEWEADDDIFNPSSTTSSTDHGNISYISLLNQEYPQTFHQSSPFNPPGNGILRQYTSHFQ